MVPALQAAANEAETFSWWSEIHEKLPCMSFLECGGQIITRNAIARRVTGYGNDTVSPCSAVLGQGYDPSNSHQRNRFECLLNRRHALPMHVSGVAQCVTHGDSVYTVIILMERGEGIFGSADGQSTFLQDLLDAAPEATAITHDGRILHVNRRFVQLFGFPLAECIGEELDSMVIPENRLHESEMLLHMLEGQERSSIQTVRKTSCGEEIDVLLAVARIRLGAEISGLLVTFQDIRQQKRQEAHLQHSALHDVLTGLANRALFLNRLQLTLARLQRRPDRNFAIFFLDLDGFKKVNDTLGHAAGDLLLLMVRDRLLRCLRPQDTVARFGGDEFALILDESGSLEQVRRVAVRVQSEIQLPAEIDGQPIRVSASIGIAMGTTAYTTAEDMTRDADRAMYEAKAGGKATHVFFGKPAPKLIL